MDTFAHERHEFWHEGRLIYAWHQSLEAVHVVAAAPPGVRARNVRCDFTATHLVLGLKGNPPYLEARQSRAARLCRCGAELRFRRQGELCEKVKASECFWTLGACSRACCYAQRALLTRVSVQRTARYTSACRRWSRHASGDAARLPRSTDASPDSRARRVQGKTWSCVLIGHALDALSCEADKKRILLERYQREHPGFDFRGAEVNGAVPDASQFMGGVHLG